MRNKILSLAAVLFFSVNIWTFAQDHLTLPTSDLVQRYIERGLDEKIPNTAFARFSQAQLGEMSTVYSRRLTLRERMALPESVNANIINIALFILPEHRGNPRITSITKEQLVGRWIDSFPAPSYCGEMRINSDNTIEIIDPQFEGYYRGTYSLDDGYLVVRVTSQFINDRWVASRNPIELRFPVLYYGGFEYGGYQVQIGYTMWYGGPN